MARNGLHFYELRTYQHFWQNVFILQIFVLWGCFQPLSAKHLNWVAALGCSSNYCSSQDMQKLDGWHMQPVGVR